MNKLLFVGSLSLVIGFCYQENSLLATNCTKIVKTLGCDMKDKGDCSRCRGYTTEYKYNHDTLYWAEGTGSEKAKPGNSECYNYSSCVPGTVQSAKRCDIAFGIICEYPDPGDPPPLAGCLPYKAGTPVSVPAGDSVSDGSCGEA